MRVLLTSPQPRWYLLLCKLLAGVAVSLVQVFAFLLIAKLFQIDIPFNSWWLLLPVLIITGLMLGSLGMLLSSLIRQLENFAGVMNFVIFPMFFMSSALYPIWKMRESSQWLAEICQVNPFTHAVELIRFALYSSVNLVSLGVVLIGGAVFFMSAVWSYNPARRFRAARTAAR